MAITSTNSLQIADTTYLVTWTHDTPGSTAYIWLDGVFIEATTRTFLYIEVNNGEYVEPDIFALSTDVPGKRYPGHFTFDWEGDTAALSYRVDVDMDGEWAREGSLPNQGQPIIRYKTPWRVDDTLYSYRVVPVGVNDGTAREMDLLMVRRPNWPTTYYTYEDDDLIATVPV